jgi:tight adherence protein B
VSPPTLVAAAAAIGANAAVGLGRHRATVRLPPAPVAVPPGGLPYGEVPPGGVRPGASPAGRRRGRPDPAVADLAVALAAELRAGRPPGDALVNVAASAGPFEEAVRATGQAIAAGAPLGTQLAALCEHTGAARLVPLAAAWTATAEHGARVAAVLDRLAVVFDEQDAAAAALSASLAGVRATIGLLAALPVLGVALGQWVGARPLRLLLTRPVGWVLLAAAAALELAGLAWSRRIVRSAIR